MPHFAMSASRSQSPDPDRLRRSSTPNFGSDLSAKPDGKRGSVPNFTAEDAELGAFIHDDAAHMMSHFQENWDMWYQNAKRPNVLVAGITGAGKSSLINTVFGQNLAKEGTGKPVTQHFTKFAPDDKAVNLYDSKGLETGIADSFISTTKQFLETHAASTLDATSAVNAIHCVWWVINCAGSRFQPFEEEICRDLLKDLPIIFILNKADVVTKRAKHDLKKCIVNLNLKNCAGIYFTTTSKYARLDAPDICPRCGEDDIISYKKKRLFQCESCGFKRHMKLFTGLESVVNATLRLLPQKTRELFIAAQNVSFKIKDRRARKIIREFFDEYKKIHLPGALLAAMASMLTRLSILWEFREHGHLYGVQLSKDLMATFSFREKVFLFMHKNKHQLLRSTALGIMWNRCVRQLARSMFHECIEERMTKEEIEEHWPVTLERTFTQLSEEHLDEVEQQLQDFGLEKVLHDEAPDDPYIPPSPVLSPPPRRSPSPALSDDGEGHGSGSVLGTLNHSVGSLLHSISHPHLRPIRKEDSAHEVSV